MERIRYAHKLTTKELAYKYVHDVYDFHRAKIIAESRSPRVKAYFTDEDKKEAHTLMRVLSEGVSTVTKEVMEREPGERQKFAEIVRDESKEYGFWHQFKNYMNEFFTASVSVLPIYIIGSMITAFEHFKEFTGLTLGTCMVFAGFMLATQNDFIKGIQNASIEVETTLEKLGL